LKYYLLEILKRRDLIVTLVASGIKAQNRNTYLGYFWWLLDPLLMSLIFYFVVVVIFQRGGENYGIYLITGLVVFRWLSTVIISSAKSIVTKSQIIKQVSVPKAIFPLTSTLSQTVSFCFALIVVALFLFIFQLYPTLYAFWLPYVILIQLLFSYAIALVLAYVSSFVMDIDNLLSHVTMLLRFGSPVIWEEDLVPINYHWALEINPLTHFLRGFRDILMHGRIPDFSTLNIIGLISVIVIVYMLSFYNRNEHKIVKIL